MRIGLGFDIHKLEKGRPFFLGGVEIPSDVGPLGHSDGDPLLHAITDALLGAAGLGDIGEHYPDDAASTKDIPSTQILQEVTQKVREKGWQTANVDANVILQRPKLAPWKRKLEANIAQILGIASDCVNVKAKTAEGLGAIGRGEAVEAQAVVLLEKTDA